MAPKILNRIQWVNIGHLACVHYLCRKDVQEAVAIAPYYEEAVAGSRMKALKSHHLRTPKSLFSQHL